MLAIGEQWNGILKQKSLKYFLNIRDSYNQERTLHKFNMELVKFFLVTDRNLLGHGPSGPNESNALDTV